MITRLRVFADLNDLDAAVFGEAEQICRALDRLPVVVKDAVDAGVAALIDYNFESGLLLPGKHYRDRSL
jgi:hypothetical protein